jgi:hypothetical protein
MPTMLFDYLSETDFERQAEASTQFTELVRNYVTLNPDNAPLLTDDFAPVETLLNPITGEPLAQETAGVYLQETVRMVAAAIVLAVAFAVLHRKKLI